MKNLLFEKTVRRVSSQPLSRLFIDAGKTYATACLVGAILMSMHAEAAVAGNANASLNVSASIVSSCVITGATLSFGTINPIASTGPINSSSPFLVKCTNSTPYSVAFGDGTHAGTGTHARNLQNASGARDLLSYQVYLDVGRTAVWGTGSGELSAATGNGMDQAVTVYAQIPDASTISPGSYSDSLTLTVTY